MTVNMNNVHRRFRHGLEIEKKFGYSAGLQYRNEIWVAGQLARDEKGKQITDQSLVGKFRKIVVNTDSILNGLNCTNAVAVNVRYYISDFNPLLIDAGIKNAFSNNEVERPAGTVVPCDGLNDVDGVVEISSLWETKTEYETVNNEFEGRSLVLGHNDEVIRRLPASSPLEKAFGFSQGIRIGNRIFVSGQLAYDDQGLISMKNDLPGQFGVAFSKVVEIVVALGGSSADLVQTETLLCRRSNSPEEFDKICTSHRELFSDIETPTGTMAYVPFLFDPDALVQVSGVAVLS
jgi:2-iminobutanoate/2-iminopropanoate deaminase